MLPRVRSGGGLVIAASISGNGSADARAQGDDADGSADGVDLSSPELLRFDTQQGLLMDGIGFGARWQAVTCNQLWVTHGIKKRKGA